MTVSSVIYHHIPFDEYLALPGKSYSGLKGAVAPTNKMRLGTKVHSYLLTPGEYDHTDAHIVKPVARALKDVAGPLLASLQPELAVTAIFEYNGCMMPYKGRMDLCLPGRLVVDFKVSEQDARKVAAYFGYDNQLSGYAAACGARRAIIIAINPKTLKVTVLEMPIHFDWWENQIVAQ